MSVNQLNKLWKQQSLPDYLMEELVVIASDELAIEDRFYQYVSCGTGGMGG